MSTRKMVVVLGLVMAFVTLVGCGDNTKDKAASSSPSSSGDDAVKAKALEMVKQYMAVPDASDWPGGGDAYNPGSHKAVVIGCGFTAEACQQPSEWAVDALKAMGWDVPEAQDSKYDP